MSALTCAIASDDDVDEADAQNIEKKARRMLAAQREHSRAPSVLPLRGKSSGSLPYLHSK